MALVAVLSVAVLMRIRVMASIPVFFGPGDPGIYLQMGRAILEHGVPKVNFIHHFLTSPHAIPHVEDYYEPAFGYLVAAAIGLCGGHVAGAPLVSLVGSGGTIAWVGARGLRSLGRAALLAAAIVAFEPWSLLYGGLLMKEAIVAAVLLAFIEIARRLLTSARAPRAIGAWLGLATFGAGLFQYELIPILGAAIVVTLVLRRSQSVGWYCLALGILVSVFAAATWLTLGVPISAKYAFFLGRPPGDPEPVRATSSVVLLLAKRLPRFLPGDYVGLTVLTSWYPLLLVLACIGLRRLDRVERVLIASTTVAVLYLHGVAHDLWARDFIPLTVILARPVGLALTDPERWWTRRWGLALIVGTLVFLFAAPPILGRWGGALLATRGLWFRVALGLGGSAVISLALWAVGRTRVSILLSRAVPWLAVLGIAWGFWLQLPYPSIPSNPQFPDYEIERARRERVCIWMKATVARGPVIARIPAETSYDSGFPSIVMPESLRMGTLDRLAGRYGARYLLVDPGAVPESTLTQTAVDLLGDREGWRLYRFRNSTLNSR